MAGGRLVTLGWGNGEIGVLQPVAEVAAALAELPDDEQASPRELLLSAHSISPGARRRNAAAEVAEQQRQAEEREAAQKGDQKGVAHMNQPSPDSEPSSAVAFRARAISVQTTWER